MNKYSKTVYQLIKYYLNNNCNAKNAFFRNYLTRPFSENDTIIRIFNHKQIKQMSIPYSQSETKSEKKMWDNIFHCIGNSHNKIDKMDKESQKETVRFNKYIVTKVLPQTSVKDLIYYDVNYSNSYDAKYDNKKEMYYKSCHAINNDDVFWLKNELYNFLIDETNIRSKIKWLLNNKKISDNKLAEKVDMSPSQITRYRTGKLKIGNMTIDNADKIDKYYQIIINRQILDGTSSMTTKKEIKDSYKNW